MSKTIKDTVVRFLPHTLIAIGIFLISSTVYFMNFKQVVDKNTEFRLEGGRFTEEDGDRLREELISKHRQEIGAINSKLDIILNTILNNK